MYRLSGRPGGRPACVPHTRPGVRSLESWTRPPHQDVGNGCVPFRPGIRFSLPIISYSSTNCTSVGATGRVARPVSRTTRPGVPAPARRAGHMAPWRGATLGCRERTATLPLNPFRPGILSLPISCTAAPLYHPVGRPAGRHAVPCGRELRRLSAAWTSAMALVQAVA
jgi:hypothetical protein